MGMAGRITKAPGRFVLALACCGVMIATQAPAGGLPAGQGALRKAVEQVYAGYRHGDFKGYTEDLTPWTLRTRALVRDWKAGLPVGELTDMSDFDWLCQCQDWDPKGFMLSSVSPRPGGRGVTAVDVVYMHGWGARGQITLFMRVEDGRWRIDDVRFKDGRMLRAALMRELPKRPRK